MDQVGYTTRSKQYAPDKNLDVHDKYPHAIFIQVLPKASAATRPRIREDIAVGRRCWHGGDDLEAAWEGHQTESGCSGRVAGRDGEDWIAHRDLARRDARISGGVTVRGVRHRDSVLQSDRIVV